MPGMLPKLASSMVVCWIAVAFATTTRSAQDGPNTSVEILTSKGIGKAKGRYVLLDEQAAFRSCQETTDAYATASQLIQGLNEAEANSQAIVAMKQRMATDRATIGNMHVFMRDGKTIALRDQLRAAEIDRNIAKGAKGRLAPAQPNAKQQRKMATLAQEAYQKAEVSQVELRQKVRDLIEEYRTLGADPQVKEAIGKARFGPSDEFIRLASFLRIEIPRPTDAEPKRPASPGATPKRVQESIEELTKAEGQLQDVLFNKKGKEFEERDRRRDQTVKALQGTIARLNKGEDATKLLDEAIRLNDGYIERGNMYPRVRDAIDKAGERMAKAAALLHEHP